MGFVFSLGKLQVTVKKGSWTGWLWKKATEPFCGVKNAAAMNPSASKSTDLVIVGLVLLLIYVQSKDAERHIDTDIWMYSNT